MPDRRPSPCEALWDTDSTYRHRQDMGHDTEGRTIPGRIVHDQMQATDKTVPDLWQKPRSTSLLSRPLLVTSLTGHTPA